MRLFVDQLTNIDFSYFCPHRGVVGETWLANIELSGELDPQGMVCDFGIVKKTIRSWLDTHLDHCLLVPANHPQVFVDVQNGICKAALTDGTACSAPEKAITVLPISEITPEAVATWAETVLKPLFAQDLGTPLSGLNLRFSTEIIEGPYYHYSHGLKKHDGACQRIAHGHRSRLEVWRNGTRCEHTIKAWCERFRDIYIATREDLVNETTTHYEFAYTSQEGSFSLSVKKERCYFIETDSTVEHIAQHIMDTMRQQYPNENISVKAFEGINKGARVEWKTDMETGT